MSLNVNFDKNRATSTDKISAYIMMDLWGVSPKGEVKQGRVVLQQRLTLHTAEGDTVIHNVDFLSRTIPGCKGGEFTQDYIISTVDLEAIEDKSIPEELKQNLGDFGTHI